MPVYEFIALDAQGKNVRGVIDADSPMAARQKIRSQGQYPVTLHEAKNKVDHKVSWPALSTFFLQRIKTGDIYILTRQLATLLGAGIPLVPALNGLIEQSRNKALQTILAQVREKSAYLFQTFENAPGIEQVTGLGLMIGLKTKKPASQVVAECMEKGVLCLTAKDKVRLLPALNIPMDLLEKAVAVLKEACK